MKRTFLLPAALAASLPLALRAPSASACSCVPSDPGRDYAYADAVFEGRVTGVRKVDEWSRSYTFEVFRTWKGADGAPDTIEVTSTGDSAMCGSEFVEGEEYLVYASDRAIGGLATGLCTGTTSLEYADEAIDYFEQMGASWTCRPYLCANGRTYDRCAEDGSMINYFAPACHADGGEVTFTDIDGDHPYFEAVAVLRHEGILEGDPAGTFRPDQGVNRVEFVKIVLRMLGFHPENAPPAGNRVDFSDVEEAAWYMPYVRKAVSLGMLKGYPDGTLKPERTINAAEAAVVVVRALGLLWGGEAEGGWYRPSVNRLQRDMYAIPKTVRSLDHRMTRAEMAELLHRVVNRIGDRPSTNL